MKWIKRIGLGLGTVVLVLMVALVVRTVWIAAPPQPAQAAIADASPEQVARLAAAVRIPTMAQNDSTADVATWQALHRHLQASFPRVHAQLTREEVLNRSLLFTWRGQDTAAAPILLLAHMDVVPVDEATRREWTADPFAGEVRIGYLYGRGTLDDKMSVLGILEAAEALLAQGYQPKRTVYFCFGHDEETQSRGAAAIVALLRQRGVQAEVALDEGLVVSEGVLPLQPPVAVVGVGEKGYVSFELSVRGPGGHSSSPPAAEPISVLAAALDRLKRNPMPARLLPPVRTLLERVAPHANFGTRLALGNLWLLQPAVMAQLAGLPAGNAMLRTTNVPTIVQGGVKENVIPTEARAVVNFRLLPGDSIAHAAAYLHRTVADERVVIRQLSPANEASSLSRGEGPGFDWVQQGIGQVFPEAVVATGLIIGYTDGRLYRTVARDVYGFAPIRIGPDDVRRIHGIDERISLRGYAEVIAFYRALLRAA